MIGAGVPSAAAKCSANRRDDHLQVRAPWQQSPKVTEDEVDVEAALVSLIDDDRVVAQQVPVVLQLGEQDSVGHHLHPPGRGSLGSEPDLVADYVTQVGLQLCGDPLSNAASSYPTWLGVADQLSGPAASPTAEFQANLGQLRRLPGSGLPRDDHHLVVADRIGDVATAGRDR
jgi:hypothetical protein